MTNGANASALITTATNAAITLKVSKEALKMFKGAFPKKKTKKGAKHGWEI